MKFFIIFTLLLKIVLNAQESKLELGAGIASLHYPDYIGSKSYRTITLPFPYIKYSSKYLSVDKNGINRKLFDNKNLTLELSVAGSLPVNSEDNELREGMPNLNFTFQAGPKLSYAFYNRDSFKVSLDLAVRVVFETDFTMLNTQGIVGVPELIFEKELDGVDITFSSGLKFGDKKQHNYFYGVDKKYETSTRSSYDAKTGFSGYTNKVSATYRSSNWWYGAFASHIYLKDAIYIDSPLVETDYALFIGASVAYIFYVN